MTPGAPPGSLQFELRQNDQLEMSATPTVPAPLAPGWAFVVQLRAGCSFEPVQMCGRVEHVASGKAGNFDSLEGMRMFMQGVLGSRHGPQSALPISGGEFDDSL